MAKRGNRDSHLSRGFEDRRPLGGFGRAHVSAGTATGTRIGIDSVGRFELAGDCTDRAYFHAPPAPGAGFLVDPQRDEVATHAGGAFFAVNVRFELVWEIPQR